MLTVFPLSAAAQVEEEKDDVIRVESNLIRLNIGVVDARGNPVTNLTGGDFTVFEDEARQDVISFEPTAAPFSVVILLDTSGSTLGFRQQLKFAAARFIDALAPDDRVAVVSFNTKTELLTKFTTDRRKIVFAINAATGRNGTKLYDALDYASNLLSKETRRRKAIVVLTDGVDSDLRNEDRQAIGDQDAEAKIFSVVKAAENKSLRRTLDEAAGQGITIYPLVLPSGNPDRLADPTPVQAAIYLAAQNRIEILANQTGGRLHMIDRLEEMGRLYAEVAADLRTLYSISYQSSAVKNRRSDGWRIIRIEVKGAGLIARTRPGYYAR